MKHSTTTARGGVSSYASPDLELLEVRIEQGFAATGGWDKSLEDYNPVYNENGLADFE